MSESKDNADIRTIRDLEVDVYLFDSVTVVPELIGEEFVRVPVDMAYWSARYASAHQDFLRAKLNAERKRAEVRISERRRLIDEHLKYTEPFLDALVDSDERYIAAEDARINAEGERARLAGVLEAVRAKKDMLVSIGAHQRAEMASLQLDQQRAAHRNSGDGGAFGSR